MQQQTPRPNRLGVLISGRGSNMKAIARACQEGRVPATIALVLSNRADAPGVEWARQQGLPCAVVSHRQYQEREQHDRVIIERLQAAGVEWVCLAGYMRLLSAAFIEAYPNRILNIHPSLLPAFPGLNAQHQAWEWGVRVSGCTVHLVDVELDHGPIVRQRAVPVADDDTAETLADRILEQEHLLYPEALNQLLSRPWHIEERRVVWESPG